jgi:hypothetical protein
MISPAFGCMEKSVRKNILAFPLDWLVVGVCDNLKVSTTDVIPQIGAGNARFGGG